MISGKIECSKVIMIINKHDFIITKTFYFYIWTNRNKNNFTLGNHTKQKKNFLKKNMVKFMCFRYIMQYTEKYI